MPLLPSWTPITDTSISPISTLDLSPIYLLVPNTPLHRPIPRLSFLLSHTSFIAPSSIHPSSFLPSTNAWVVPRVAANAEPTGIIVCLTPHVPIYYVPLAQSPLPSSMTSRHQRRHKIRGLSHATHVHCYACNGRRTQVLSAGKMAQRRQVDAAKRQGYMAGNAVPLCRLHSLV